jgi:acetyltransferase-like isoleucine patch superfamily enzyme
MPVNNVEGFEGCICHHSELVNLYECEIGEGAKIGAFVEIGRGVKIGKDCKIQSFAFIPEGVVIGDNVFIGPHVVFCNVKFPMAGDKYQATVVMNGAIIGAGAVILPGITIGERAFVGAGAVVTKNVRAGETVMGNPARVQERKN